MALSLPGERSVAAGSHVINPVRALIFWLAQAKARRTRRAALVSLLHLDQAQYRDLGISAQDVAEAMVARADGRTPGMILNAARARAARN